MWLFARVICLAGVAALASWARADAPLVISRMTAPKIDGVVEAREWEAAAAVPAFVENKGGRAPAAQTLARVGFDDANLYVAMECAEPAIDKVVRGVKAERDGEIWSNECVELLLNPAGDRAGYVHLGVDILNQRYDALGSDPWGFNPPWESATRIGEKSWTVEMAIPFASLGVEAAKSGQHWFANLCRERQAQAELSAWRPAGGQFGAPGTFGTWVFGSLSDYLLKSSQELDSGAEVAAWRERVKASDGKIDADGYAKLSGELDALRKQRVNAKQIAAREGGKRFVVTRGSPYAAFDASPREDHSTLDPINVTLLQDEYVDLAFDVTNLTDQSLVLRCTTRHGDERDNLDYARLGIPGIEASWSQAIAIAAGDGREVYDAIIPSPAGTIHVPAGRSTQVWLTLHAPADAKGKADGRIIIQPIDMNGGEALRLLLSISTIPLKLTENPPIHCFTWNFAHIIEEQPKWWEQHLRDLASHGVDVCMISSLNHLPRTTASPDGTMPAKLDFTKLDRLLDASRGLFRLYWINLDVFEKAKFRTDLIGLEFGSPAYERGLKQWLRQVFDHLREKGVKSDQFIVNPYDESVDERCRLLAKWVKEVDPKVRIVIDSSTPDLETARQMDALTDIWVPHFRQFAPPEMKPFHDLLRASGKPVWTYFYSEGSNDKAQDPSAHYLSKFWWAFANDVTGMGYWAQQYYGDPWYRRDWKDSYDTALWYPIEAGVAPSRRWEAWRRGWQDYLLLAQAQKTLRDRNDADGLKKLDQIMADVVKSPRDTSIADEGRAWLKQTLANAGKGKQ